MAKFLLLTIMVAIFTLFRWHKIHVGYIYIVEAECVENKAFVLVSETFTDFLNSFYLIEIEEWCGNWYVCLTPNWLLEHVQILFDG